MIDPSLWTMNSIVWTHQANEHPCLDKVKTIFTPRKRLNIIDTPRKAKDTCNITITDMSNPDTIIEELVNVVSGKHLLYERKR